MGKKPLYHNLLHALLLGDHQQCSNLVSSYLADGLSVIDIYETIIKKAMYQVGLLWEFNKISVAAEHLASAIVESLMNEHYMQLISNLRLNKKIIVACVEQEYHQIGIKMVSDVFEKHGWNSYFLGANVPIKDLISYAKTVNPDFMALSIGIYSHLPILQKMIEALRLEFPELCVLVGGQAFLHGDKEVLDKYYKVVYLNDLSDVEQFMQSLN